jgi:hypothetical protein
MLTVMELLSFPLFRNFKIVSGYGGLYNQVKGTGILEWESSSDVERNFGEGEFVVTTLSMSRSDAVLAEASIRTLIDKKVSAVAIKDVYYHEISDELKAYSDARQVPVFFFSETFFDDIIYTIKNALLAFSRDFNRDEQLEALLDGGCSTEQKKKKAKEINPFFHGSIVCCFASLKKQGQWQKEMKTPPLDPAETVYSVVEYQQGLLVIYTMKDPTADKSGPEDKLMNFLEKSDLKRNLCRIGIGTPVKGLENLGTVIQESLYANSSCLLDQSESLRFCDSGLDRILLPAADSAWTRQYYEKLLSKIMEYDAKHGAKLMGTLMEYAENGGDMKLTAQKMFQHSNTIRYRIEKIKNLLELGDDAGSFTQLYLFVRLHQIYMNRPDI